MLAMSKLKEENKKLKYKCAKRSRMIQSRNQSYLNRIIIVKPILVKRIYMCQRAEKECSIFIHQKEIKFYNMQKNNPVSKTVEGVM